jgi:hypothetical protein
VKKAMRTQHSYREEMITWCPQHLCLCSTAMWLGSQDAQWLLPPQWTFPQAKRLRCWTSGATSVINPSRITIVWAILKYVQYHSTIPYLTHWKLQLSSLPRCPPWMPKSWVLGYKLLEPHLGCSHFSLVELACSLLPSEILVTLWPMWNSHHQKSKIAQVTI